MNTRLEYVLEHNLNGREVAIWGTPNRLLLRLLKPYAYHVAGQVDPKQHFVVAVTDDDLKDFYMDDQSEPFEYVFDCLTLNDLNAELPFEWDCHGVPIGRFSYFGQPFVDACEYGFVERIGHFTSISKTAIISVNHQLNMMFTSDDIQEIFTEENLSAYNRIKFEGPNGERHRISIGNDVWIGANSFINASKVKSIGDGAIIGSGAVVLEDVPPYAVVVGMPAKIKRYRFELDVIETLQRIKWWDWSFDEINANAAALFDPNIFMDRFGHK